MGKNGLFVMISNVYASYNIIQGIKYCLIEFMHDVKNKQVVEH